MKHHHGFAHVVLIIGLVLALIGALGFVFWQNFIHEEPKTKNEIVTGTEIKKVKTEDDNKQMLSAEQVNSVVENTYKEYISERKSGSSVTESLAAIRNDFTEGAYETLTKSQDVEGLTCAGNYIPDSVAVSTSIQGYIANSKVTRVYESQTASTMIQVVTDITTGKIASVSCPS